MDLAVLVDLVDLVDLAVQVADAEAKVADEEVKVAVVLAEVDQAVQVQVVSPVALAKPQKPFHGTQTSSQP